MDLLIIHKRRGGKTLNLLDWRSCIVLLLFALALAGVFTALGYMLGHHSANRDIRQWTDSLQEGREDIARISDETSDSLNALALNIGQLEAHSLRLDALGSRLAGMAGLDEEFDFTSEPAVGGPIDVADISSHPPELFERFTELQRRLDDRQHKLYLLESIMMDRELTEKTFPEGKPIKRGWLSSGYGYRADPFTGERAWHAGIDFAGKRGTNIVSVGSGLVIYAGAKPGFGKIVEVNHGDGYVTRYAHNSKNLVKVGDTVQRGDVIAKMGTTGRSTGYHVHFEVLYNGEAVNPQKYIQRVARQQ